MVGISFGLTSAVITTLGLMVGLHSGTRSRLAVIGGVLTIAFADAFSDALGIHMSEESEAKHTSGEIWLSTAATFLSKLGFALTFLIPLLLLDLQSAIIANLVWGFILLAALSYKFARDSGGSFVRITAEHLTVAAAVVIIAHFIGELVSAYFGG
jgi:VIT1/CCC1 family predicted Fe2+/Mn2+ transporter